MPGTLKSVSFTSPYDAEAQEIERRRALAQALQQQGQTPLGPTETIGGWAIPRSPMEGLGKAAQQISGAYQQKQLTEQQKALSERMANERSQALAQALRMGQGAPASSEQIVDETGVNANAGGTGLAQINAPAQAPNPMAMYQSLMQSRDPVLMQLGTQGVMSQMPKPLGPFKLGPGDVQYDAQGRHVASAPFKPQNPLVHDMPVAGMENMVQPHQYNTQTGKWEPVPGSTPIAKFAKQVAPTIINPPAPTMSEVVDPSDPTRMLKIDARIYKGGSVGSPGVVGVAGKEPGYAKREEKEGQGRELLKAELDNLRAHFGTLNEARAIPSDARGGLSNAVAWMQGSTAGQLGGRVLGTKEQTARNEIQSARLRLLNAIKNATGMSAQQLNSNAELKTWLDSMTSMTGSYESNIGILDAIEKAFSTPKRRASDALPDEPPAGAVRRR